jgi:hypothetical protein
MSDAISQDHDQMDNSFDSSNDENSIKIWNDNQDLLDLIEQYYDREHLYVKLWFYQLLS